MHSHSSDIQLNKQNTTTKQKILADRQKHLFQHRKMKKIKGYHHYSPYENCIDLKTVNPVSFLKTEL